MTDHPQRSTAQKRTNQQSKALHLMLSKLADELNEKGLTMKVVLKPHVEIRWTLETIKDYLWRPLQRVMLGKESTKELTTAEVDKVFEMLQHHLGEKHGIELTFPSIESLIELSTGDPHNTP